MNKLLITTLIFAVLLVGTFSFIGLNDDKEIKYKLNDCEPIIKNGDSINKIVERYEKQSCFEGYELFLEENK
jgi:cell division protein YceG involved in septum cleavage